MFHSPLKRWDLALSCLFLAGAILFGLSAYQGSTFIMLSVLGLVKLRCPFCHHFLGFLSAGSHHFCPWCGDQLSGSDND